ncbi:MAG: hypothetical protein ABI605_16690 [Rhizobacter sp.]
MTTSAELRQVTDDTISAIAAEPPSAEQRARLSAVKGMSREIARFEKTMAAARKLWNIPEGEEVQLC